MIRKGVVVATKLFQAFGDSFCFVVIAFPFISIHVVTCASTSFSFMSFPRFVNILSRLEVGPFPRSTSNKINKICLSSTFSLRGKSNPAPSEWGKVPHRRGVVLLIVTARPLVSIHFLSCPLMSFQLLSCPFLSCLSISL